MFVGAISASAKKVLYNLLAQEKDKGIITNLGSGNFTIEAIAKECGFKKIQGCDVSLLSVAFGRAVNGELTKIKIVNPIFEPLKEFENTSALDNMAIIGLINIVGGKLVNEKWNASEILKFYEKNQISEFRKIKNMYAEKLKKIRLDNFYPMCCTQLLASTNIEKGLIVSFLPTYTGGYEKIYNFLESSIEWEQIPYTLIDSEKYNEINAEILERGGIVITDRILENVDRKHIVGVASNPSNRDMYFYKINQNQKVLNYLKSSVPYKIDESRLFKESDFENLDNLEIKIKECTQKTFKHLREIFLSSRIQMLGNGDFHFLVYLGDKLVGAFCLKITKDTNITFQLLSDFSVINSRKISKLVPMVAKSLNTLELVKKKKILEAAGGGGIESIVIFTIAFSKNPVSMKYRSIYNLTNRRDDENGYRLTYTSHFENKDIREIFQQWKSKYYKG